MRQGKKLDEQTIEIIKRLHNEGKSYYYIARKLGISEATARKYSLQGTSPQKTTLQENNISQQKEYTSGETMPEEDYKVKIALLERDISDLKKYIEQLTKKPEEKKPLIIHKDGNLVEAYCPNCGVNATLPLEQKYDVFGEKKIYTWNDIEKFLTSPHEHGENILKCEKCGPKFKEWLESQGYELVEKGEKKNEPRKSRR